MAFSRLFTLLGSKPKTRTGNKFPKAKAKDDLQGQGQGLGIRGQGQGLNFRGQGQLAGLEAKAMSSRTPTLIGLALKYTHPVVPSLGYAYPVADLEILKGWGGGRQCISPVVLYRKCAL